MMKSAHMTILGIDYGTRWLGLALGDTQTKLAFPRETLEQGPLLFARLQEICAQEDVKKIVVGLPGIWQGTQFIQSAIKHFGAQLEQSIDMEVVFAEELLTSTFAERVAPKNARRSNHAQAATLILENYFQKIPMPKLQ